MIKECTVHVRIRDITPNPGNSEKNKIIVQLNGPFNRLKDGDYKSEQEFLKILHPKKIFYLRKKKDDVIKNASQREDSIECTYTH